MSTQKNLITLCFATVFALGLAACGGGGDDGGPPMTSDTGEPPVKVDMKVDLAGVTNGSTAEDGILEIKAGTSEDSGNTAFECAADGDDCTVTVTVGDDDAVSATSTGGMVMAGNSADHQKEIGDADTAAAKAATDKALAIAMALNDTSMTMAATDNSVPDTATATRSTEAAGGEIKITVSSSENTGLAPAYAMSEDMSPPAIDGWNGQTHMRSPEDAPVEIVNIYTNIQEAKANKLVYGVNDIPPPAIQAVIVFDDAEKPSYTGYDDEAEQDDETAMGSFNGIPGTFTCTTGTCSVNFVATPGPGVAKGTVSEALGAGWAFESTDDAESQAAQKDDYLYFGYWLQANEEDNEFAFATFSGGGVPPFTALGNLEGKATYNGAAGGKYVEKELGLVDGQAKPISASGGYFTATATLTATFGGTAIPMDDHDKITGVINNFKDGTTGDDLDFTVNLSADIGENGLTVDSAAVTAAHGNLPNTGGTWDATFFGPIGEGDVVNTTLPTGVAGNFEAHFADGHVAGGYAATR